MAELRLFVRAQPEMVLEDLEAMFELAKEPGIYEQQAGAQGFSTGFNFGKLYVNTFDDSGWLGELFSRVRRDMDLMATLNPEDYKDVFTDVSLEASPSDWAIAMLLIWDHTPIVIIIALALVFLGVMKHLRRKY